MPRQKLSEFLDEIGVKQGDERGFVLYEDPNSACRMEVSRRYIESEPWRYLLDKEIAYTMPTTNIYGIYTIAIVLK